MSVLKDKINLKYVSLTSPCDICYQTKQTGEPFPLSDYKTTYLGELIHLDLWGPYVVTSKDGFKYFLTIVDDYTRAVCVYLLKGKTEVYDTVVMFFNLLKNQFSRTVKVLRSDNGTEFVNFNMNTFLEKHGVVHQTSCAYTPQQNGVV